MSDPTSNDQELFESVINSLRSQIANAGAHLMIDGAARASYDRQVREMSADLRAKAMSGQITWRQAADEASTVRNLVMDTIRGRSTPVGRAIAESIKKDGKTLNQLVAEKTTKLYGPRADFNNLSTTQKNKVYAEIVSSAGRSNAAVTGQMQTLSKLSRGLVFVSISLSVYNIAVSENPQQASVKEVALAGSGFGGGVAGGAIAGLACGPGAPVCVTVGAFVGGALAAFGVDYFFF